MKAEMERRQSGTQKLLELFHARPCQWISWCDLGELGGNLAWRTRVSDCRKIVTRAGGQIEWNKNIRDSRYRYLPHTPLGRDASEQVPRRWNETGAFQGEPFSLKP